MPDPDPWHREARAREEREWDELEQVERDIQVLSEAAFRPARASQERRVRQTISLTMDRVLLAELDRRARNRSRFVEGAVRAALSFEARDGALAEVVREVALGRVVDPAVARAALEDDGR